MSTQDPNTETLKPEYPRGRTPAWVHDLANRIVSEWDGNGDTDMLDAPAEGVLDLIVSLTQHRLRLGHATAIIEHLSSVIAVAVTAAGQGNLVDALKLFHYLDTQYEALDKARKKIYGLLDSMDKGMLPAMFEASGQDLARIPELGRSFYPTTKYSARVGDKEGLYKWLRENNGEDLIQETVNSSSLAGFLKSMSLEQGIDAPPEVAELVTYKIIGSSKYTPK